MINGILAAEELLASRVAHTFRTYPKQITAAIAALLLCAGGGAFAVASLGPDASELPVRQVFEAVKPLPFADQVDALDTHSFTLFRTEITRSSDTAEALLRRLGIADPAAAAFVRGNAEARTALLGRPGRTVTAEATHDNTLQKLSARWMPDGDGGFKRLVVEKTGGSFRARTETDALTPGTRLASGIVRSSLFAATDDARIPDAVASQLADIFSGDVDFRALRKGDRFAVVYETFDADGQPLRTGRVLSAEFESNGKLHQALWFQEPGQKGGYYRPNGDSLRRAYLSSPVEFSRVIERLRDAHASDPQQLAPAQRHRLRGTHRHRGARRGRRHGRVRGHAERLRQHRDRQAPQQPADGLRAPEPHRRQGRPERDPEPDRRRGRLDRLGHRAAPALRVPRQRRVPRPLDHRAAGRRRTDLGRGARPAFERLALATRTELAAAFSVVQASAD